MEKFQCHLSFPSKFWSCQGYIKRKMKNETSFIHVAKCGQEGSVVWQRFVHCHSRKIFLSSMVWQWGRLNPHAFFFLEHLECIYGYVFSFSNLHENPIFFLDFLILAKSYFPKNIVVFFLSMIFVISPKSYKNLSLYNFLVMHVSQDCDQNFIHQQKSSQR